MEVNGATSGRAGVSCCTTLIGLVLGVGALVACALFYPAINIKLERQSLEQDLRMGHPYSDFLADTEWITDTIPTVPGEVAHVRDIPHNHGPPLVYKLSRAAAEEECPVDLDSPDMGGEAAALEILGRSEKIMVMDRVSADAIGVNAIGCGNSSYANLEEIKSSGGLDLEIHSLHFDGEHHKVKKSSNMHGDDVRTVSTFFSNFSEAKLTAPLHSTFVSSRVVQCRGTKTWFFLPPDCCNSFGHHLYSGATLGKGFLPDTKLTVLTTRAGDVVTFGSFQHHIVLTHPGPSFMQTHRIVTTRGILEGVRNFGWSMVQAVMDARATNKDKTTANQATEHPLRAHCANRMKRDVRNKIVAKAHALGQKP